MGRLRTLNKKVIELFDEKTGNVVRTICFRSPKEFDELRYPGYGWRYRDKGRKKGENNLVNQFHKT
jgi:hypothetical protein